MHVNSDQTPPQIFEYDDYRAFLRDLYAHLKRTKPQFSYRYFSARAGFQSPNFLKLVIDGKRNLSNESIDRFVAALKLGKDEASFFKNLVLFNQASNHLERTENAAALMKSRAIRKFQPLRQAQYDYYACWYYIPIRELVKCRDFREDPEWIAERFSPALKPQDVKRALEDLEKLGLLVRDGEGRLQQSHENLATDDEVVSSQIASYHREMMKRASDSIEAVARTEREISAVCVPVSERAMAKIKARIQEFREEILAIASEDLERDAVYQLGFQLFPLTKKKGA